VSGPRGDVFINCPFDEAYKPVFDAVVFAVLACRYRVRSALEITDGGETRLAKIFRLIQASSHSIHDISRVELDRDSNLPRFNMPLELGIALGYRQYAAAEHPHRVMIVDSERYRYQTFASDLAGIDIAAHGGKPADAIACVRRFLSSDDPDLPTADVIEALYHAFEAALPSMAAAKQQSMDKLDFRDRLRLAETFINAQKQQ
jgi:hypothetical protein